MLGCPLNATDHAQSGLDSIYTKRLKPTKVRMHVKVNPIRTREEVRPLRKSQETIVQTEVGTFTDARDAAHDLICLDVTEQVPDVSYLAMNQWKVKHIQLEKRRVRRVL